MVTSCRPFRRFRAKINLEGRNENHFIIHKARPHTSIDNKQNASLRKGNIYISIYTTFVPLFTHSMEFCSSFSSWSLL